MNSSTSTIRIRIKRLDSDLSSSLKFIFYIFSFAINMKRTLFIPAEAYINLEHTMLYYQYDVLPFNFKFTVNITVVRKGLQTRDRRLNEFNAEQQSCQVGWKSLSLRNFVSNITYIFEDRYLLRTS